MSIKLDITFAGINMFSLINLLALSFSPIQTHFMKLQVNVILSKNCYGYNLVCCCSSCYVKKWALRFTTEVS